MIVRRRGQTLQHTPRRRGVSGPEDMTGRRGTAGRRDRGRLAPWLVAALATASWSAYAVTQWRLYESPSWDLGIFTQLAQAYARFEAPIVTIKGEGFNLLGDHFHPLLVLLGPPYALFPSGLTLLLVQALLFGLSAVPLTSVARELLGPRLGVASGLAYALSWGLASAVAVQFHEIAFAVPLLAASLAAYLRRRWWVCAAWSAPLVFVKEDLGLTVLALGLVLWWHARQRRVGAALAAWGAAWFMVTILVILPALNPLGGYDYYDRLAAGEESDGLTALLELVAHTLTPATKYLTLGLLVLAAGVVGVRSPLLWLMVPTLGWRFAGNVEHYWGWEWHYSAVLMPIAAAALIDGARAQTGRTLLGGLQQPLPAQLTRAAVAVAAATTLIMGLTGPMARLAEADTWAGSGRADAAAAAMARVDPGSDVETDIYLMAYLVPRAQVYWYGNPGTGTDDVVANPAPDHLVLDASRREWTMEIPDAAALAEWRHPGTSYSVVFDRAGYQVAERLD
ncbi:DUF2079 domain-containing protein [Bogoriella caseilytica]|uniref:Putative membrane protein DUF2079 n=1 Tax=Bogoriella caseilytica TaxID=56055 RepID=A0A3N2BBV1_9MICO|nr:DUF2079 domain-containing protein [Bogoriella caseilytica]ROR72733.1 putative membrane protein DUF2079 [Bogoriella caseilytica]